MKIFNDWTAEQVSSATHERKKLFLCQNFSPAAVEWKTVFVLYLMSALEGNTFFPEGLNRRGQYWDSARETNFIAKKEK